MHRRYLIVGVTAIAALWMYIDRVCISIVADPIQVDLGLTDREKSQALGAFFFTYALFQVPMGSLADRFGPRLVLALSIAGWSVVTASAGFAWSFLGLMAARLSLGIAEAGAYPAAAGLIKRWAKPSERGRFSGIVALGGRLGMANAPALTGWIATTVLAGVGLAAWIGNPSGVNWRAVFVLYGTIGMLVALVFWFVVSDYPTAPSEKAILKAENDEYIPERAKKRDPETSADGFFARVKVLAGNRGMWLFGGLQFSNNVSWAFLVTLLPTFLKDSGLSLEDRKDYQTGILYAGCLGMLVGGVATDAIYRRYGPRWGRSLPIGVMMGCAAITCAVLSLSLGIWVSIVALALMAMFQDLGIPSVWAYAQDVGGKNVGTALGWGNMWGNLGAALSPPLLMETQLHAGWTAAFGLCACAYVVSATCGLLLDASKPIDAGEGGLEGER